MTSRTAGEGTAQVKQVSFAKYHSENNFVGTVHVEESQGCHKALLPEIIFIHTFAVTNHMSTVTWQLVQL